MEDKKSIYTRRGFFGNFGVALIMFWGLTIIKLFGGIKGRTNSHSAKRENNSSLVSGNEVEGDEVSDIIKTIKKHRSIRRFKDKELPDDVKQTMLECAVRAPTTAMGHFYSIIEVKDASLRRGLYDLCGRQESMKRSSFFVFTADLRRSRVWADHLGVERKINEFTAFQFATIDATLAAQNFSLAAESLGLGTVFIGMIGHKAFEVCELLDLPSDVLPLYGMAVGYPDENPALRPRIPVRFMHHVDWYQDMTSDEIDEAIDAIGNWSSSERPLERNKSQKQNLAKSILTGNWWVDGERSLKKALRRQSWMK